MKKVLYYVSTFPTFSENFITREIEALEKSKNLEIKILALEKGKKGVLPEALKDKVIYFQKSKFERSCDFGLYFLLHPLKTLKLLFKYNSRILSLGTAVSMLPIVEKFAPDTILGNWITEGGLMANILSDLSGIPFGIQCHAQDIWYSSKEWIESRVKDAKFVVSCTKNNIDYLKSLVNEKYWHKFQTVYHFIDPNIFEGKVANFNEKPIIFAIGRMVEKKGYIYLIKAAKILSDKGYNFELRFAGDAGTEKEKLIEETRKLSLTGVVKFSDEVLFDNLKHNFLESDIFVAPSIKSSTGDMDGIPNVIIEAMLAGLPVVSTKLSAIPEVVEDEVTGFLVTEKDEEALAEKLEILIKESPLRETLGKAGREKILKMFSYENTVSKLERLLKE